MTTRCIFNKANIALAVICYSLSFNANASTDCTLITKFSFFAADAYSRGMSEDSFVTMTFAGFMRGHKNLLDDPRASAALTNTLSNIYADVAKMGSGLH